MNWVELLKQGATDRREHYRASRHVAVQATLTSDGSQTVVGGARSVYCKQDLHITDVGPGGLRLEGAGRLVKGQTLRLSASGIAVRVVWARKKKDSDLFECGTQFVLDTAEQAEVVTQFLLEDCDVGIFSPHEKRKYLRVPVAENVSGQLALADGVKVPVRVRDLAMSGALLVSPEPVYPGTAVRARIPLMSDQPALECAGEVVRQSRTRPPDAQPVPLSVSSDHELGVQFTRVSSNHQELLKKFLVKTLMVQSPRRG